MKLSIFDRKKSEYSKISKFMLTIQKYFFDQSTGIAGSLLCRDRLK